MVRDVRRHAVRAGLRDSSGLTVHCFRKSRGQNWANNLPMHVVKELMGHASITTTAEFYTKVCEEHEEQARRVGQGVLFAQTRNETDARLTPGAESDRIRAIG